MQASARALTDARERILEWWHAIDALSDEVTKARFINEATAALPGSLAGPQSPTTADIFDGLLLQRATLKRDQQLKEWTLHRNGTGGTHISNS